MPANWVKWAGVVVIGLVGWGVTVLAVVSIVGANQDRRDGR